MISNRELQTRLSATWAAYGDALGFITELADADRVQYRAGSRKVTRPVEWRRKIGSYGGASVIMPAGSYSDDTQLRLATSRAIRSDGSFDVASFAKVELPAWANYALGAGIGSREAAANLARTSATWYSNFFENKRATYVLGGGNGAAMRIQPHVWSAPNLSDRHAIFRDVVRNTVCTHGHPRAIVGACFHAATLALALAHGAPPDVNAWEEVISSLHVLPDLIITDGDLRLFWVGPWLEKSGGKIEDAFARVIDELLSYVVALAGIQEHELSKAYSLALDVLTAREPESRGSGTKTAMLAAFLAARCDLSQPFEAIEIAANCLGSDTDSIGTMFGAIVGACTAAESSEALQDRRYIEIEASRLAAIATKEPTTSFRYPDLRSWKPARAAVDAIARADDCLILEGIGRLKPAFGSPVQDRNEMHLQWFELEFGQTILGRVRDEPRKASSAPYNRTPSEKSPGKVAGTAPKLPDLFLGKGDRGVPRSEPARAEPMRPAQAWSEPTRAEPTRAEPTRAEPTRAEPPSATLNQMLQEVIESGFDPKLVGSFLLGQVESGRSNFVERGIALTATVLTAYEARMRRRK